LENDPSPSQLSKAIQNKWHVDYNDIAIVGFGEPLLNIEGTLKAIKTLKSLTYQPIRINTNGQALLYYPNRDIPKELADVGLSRVQVSLNAQDAETYEHLCRPQFGYSTYKSILEFISRCKNLMDVEISVLDFPGVDIDACQKIASSLDVDFHLRTFKGPREVVFKAKRLLEH
jgi:TatD family-associated radical SAM protein